MSVDLPNLSYSRPPCFDNSLLRPDILLWSSKHKQLNMFELTVCYEENFVTSANFKECKYKDLVSQCRKAGRRTELFTIQVGSRGLIDQESFEGLTNFTGVKTKDA